MKTIVIESADLGALRATRRLVGIGDLPNMSYAMAIPWLLGWDTAEPKPWSGANHG